MKIEIKYGILIAVAGTIWLVLEYAFGFHGRYIELQPMVSAFAFLVPVIGLLFALKEIRRKKFDGRLPYWQGVKSGARVSLVTGVLNLLTQLFYHRLLNPNYFPFMIEKSRERALAQGATGEALEQAVRNAEQYFNLSSYMLQASIGALVIGIVISMIIMAFLRTKPARQAA